MLANFGSFAKSSYTGFGNDWRGREVGGSNQIPLVPRDGHDVSYSATQNN